MLQIIIKHMCMQFIKNHEHYKTLQVHISAKKKNHSE